MTDEIRGSLVIDVRVYYEDTDVSGVVYHANYLRYFERERTEWLDQRGLNHRWLADNQSQAFTLAGMSARFVRPARLDDVLWVSVAIAERRPARVVFLQAICAGRGH